ncbi:MAG: protein-disulfide reductase DsbD family protein [Chlamydiales bacterium]
MKRLFFSSLVLFSFFSPLLGSSSNDQTIDSPVQVQLVAEENSIKPGRPFWLGIELKMAEGWDTYWMNPGDSGFPTQVNWKLPKGFIAGPLEWPYPKIFKNSSLVAFGYTDTVLLLSKILPPKNIENGSITLAADVNWLACKDLCVPGNAHISLSLPINNSEPVAIVEKSGLFAKAREALPRQLEDQGNLTVQLQPDEIVMNFKPKPGSFGEIEEMQFISEDAEVVDYGAPQSFKIEQEGIILNLKKMHSTNKLSALKGVLLVSEKGTSVKKAIQINTPPKETQQIGAEAHQTLNIKLALLFAFLGGLILNVMPCVLPVIALKIFGFVKIAHERRKIVLKHGGVFALGVLVSFWILSIALLIMRACGESIGWGFQLQEPAFVAILAAMLFLLGLSLFGVFELGTSMISLGSQQVESSGGSSLKNSFMSGILATLVATPCTGPLLGPALGFAMTLSPFLAVTVFTMMGFGMAFPYLIFSAFPKLISFLPKPGNWMVIFKQLMGFLMMGTVVWLIWIFGAQTDNMATFALLSVMVILALGGWIFGKWSLPTKRKITRILSTTLAVALFLLGGTIVIFVTKQHRNVEVAHALFEQDWEVYNPQRVEELRAQGIPVFVDFTAKWCLICQANKAILHSSDLKKAFYDKGVVKMTADWTKKNPVITEALDNLGRTGVPLYVLYSGHPDEKPYVLPQTLSGSIVYKYLEKLTPSQTTVYAD